MSKKYILFILGLLVSLGIFSQAQNKQEFSVWGMGGLSTLKYDLNSGNRTSNLGCGIGIGYKYYFSDIVAINTGLEFSLYNSKSEVNRLQSSYITQDIDKNAFEFRTVVNDYEENQNVSYLNIPLMLHFEIPTGESKFYAAGGIKIGIPLNGKYKPKEGTIVNSGYYEFEDYEYTSKEELGFGTYRSNNKKADLDLKLAYMLSLETGMKWNIGEKMYLYTGLYCDYGLNNVIDEKNNKEFILYNSQSPRDPIINSMLFSQYTQNGKTESFTNKTVPFAAGVKISLAFSL